MNTERNFDRHMNWKEAEGENPPMEWDREKVWCRVREAVPARRRVGYRPLLQVAAAVLLVLFLGVGAFEWTKSRNPARSVAGWQRPATASTAIAEPESRAVIPAAPVVKQSMPLAEFTEPKTTKKGIRREPVVNKKVVFQSEPVAVSRRDLMLIESIRTAPGTPRVLNSMTAAGDFDLTPPTSAVPAKIVLRVPAAGETNTATKPFFSRLLQQVKNFNTAGEIDWQDFNIHGEDPLSFSIYRTQRDSTSALDLDD